MSKMNNPYLKIISNYRHRECFGGIVKPVNLSERANEHPGEVKKKGKEVMVSQTISAASKLCHLCVLICDSQGVSTLVCDNIAHLPNQKHTTVVTAHFLFYLFIFDQNQTLLNLYS